MKHPDSESSDDYAWLFDQLSDIGDGITSNLQFEQLAEFDVESSRLLSQRDALNHLETAQFPDDIADILDFLRNNPTIDVNAMFNDILENIALLPTELQHYANELAEVLELVLLCAELLRGDVDIKAAQVRGLTTEYVTQQIRDEFLAVMQRCTTSTGIDTSDPIAVQDLLDRDAREQLEYQKQREQRQRFNEALDSNEAEFLERYNVHTEDPLWRNIRSLTIIAVSIAQDFAEPGLVRPISSRQGIHKKLDSLSIPHHEYDRFVASAIEQASE